MHSHYAKPLCAEEKDPSQALDLKPIVKDINVRFAYLGQDNTEDTMLSITTMVLRVSSGRYTFSTIFPSRSYVLENRRLYIGEH